MEGERGLVQPRHLVREMVAMMRETFPREIELAETAPADVWPVMGDATQLHQVLMNLCVNARDAMPNGGRLSIAAQNAIVEANDLAMHPQAKPGPHVLLTVADTGEGIPREHLVRIFEPFFTTKELGKGTGLGLSTVLGIVKGHGGFVTVYSEVARGTVFKIYLPADMRTAETTHPESVASWRGQRELVLVVDDEPAIRIALTRALESNDYRVLCAANGQEAIEQFRRHRNDVRLVFTDLMMPGMTGVALIRALREIEPGIRVVAASGLQDRDRKEELLALGVAEILAKPCTLVEVLQAVNRQLNRPD
jgi:CheY-like chemotaxis protein